MSAVSASGLLKRFGATTALSDVSIGVEAGEVHGLLGANGAGKTTLLRILFGLIAPDAGTVQLLGRPLGGPGSAALDRVGGFVEEPTFYPYLSGAANLALLARLDGGETSRERMLAALARVELDGRADDRVGGYSTGMRQRLGIAAALLREPRVLLLDEPTSGLDPAGADEVARLVRELAGEGVAVMLSSHQIGELERICDGYTFLHRGQVVWRGPAERLRAEAPAAAYALLTSDDARAAALAERHPGVHPGPPSRGRLTLTVTDAELDGFVLALAAAGIAVRRLEQTISPLESMFFALSDTEPAPVPAAAAAAAPAGAR